MFYCNKIILYLSMSKMDKLLLIMNSDYIFRTAAVLQNLNLIIQKR